MAITAEETVESREWQWNPAKATFHYQVKGTSSDTDAKTALLAEAGATYEGLTRGAISLDPEWVDTVADDGLWNCEVNYIITASVDKEPLALGESSYSFDTGGGTQHITQSISTTEKYAQGGSVFAPSYKGAIGVSGTPGDYNVEGTDIASPVYTFSETHVLTDDAVTAAYKRILFSLTGKTNDALFKGLLAGECLFLGASGSKRGDTNWEITFNFAGSPNRTLIVIGDITVPAKLGWEYLWVLYADKEDAAAVPKKIVQQPISAYVEQVYYDGDFDLLGI